MTVASATSSASYTGNGSTTAFAIPFYFLQNTDVVIQMIAADGTATTAVLDSDYSLTGAGNEAGGTATLGTAPADGVKVYITRVVTLDQETAYPQDTPFPAASHEQALDKLTMVAQQLQRAIDAALSLSTSSIVGGVSAAVPDPVANDLLGWDQFAKTLVNIPQPDAGTGTYVPGFSGALPTRMVADKLRESISVKDFGAKGDGATDDTAAFQNAVTFLSASTDYRGAVLLIPPGHYMLKSSIAIGPFDLLDNIAIRGAGRTTTTLDFSGAPSGTHGITFSGGTQFEVSDLEIANCPGAAHGIYLGYGLTVGGGTYCHDFTIRNVRSQGHGGSGIFCTNTYGGTFVDCWCSSNGGNGFTFNGYHTSIACIRCEASSNASWSWAINGMTYSTFISCGADGSTTEGGYAISNVRGVAFVSCGAESNYKDGFTLLTSDATAAGIPTAAQDIHGLVLESCFGYANSAGSAGTYGTFLGASTANSRPMDFKVVGGSATPATASDLAITMNAASGSINAETDGFYRDGFETSDSLLNGATIVNQTLRGKFAIATMSAAQSLTSGALTNVALTTLGTNDLGATVSSAAVVIPANVSKVRITAGEAYTANAAGVRQLFVLKNGAAIAGLPGVTGNAAAAGGSILSVASPPIPVAPGDAISLQAFQSSGSALNLSSGVNNTFLAIEAVG